MFFLSQSEVLAAGEENGDLHLEEMGSLDYRGDKEEQLMVDQCLDRRPWLKVVYEQECGKAIVLALAKIFKLSDSGAEEKEIDQQLIADYEKIYGLNFAEDFEGFIGKLMLDLGFKVKEQADYVKKYFQSRVIFSLVRSHSDKIEELDESELYLFLSLLYPTMVGIINDLFKEGVVDFLLSKLDFMVEYCEHNKRDCYSLGGCEWEKVAVYHEIIISNAPSQEQKKRAWDHFVKKSLNKHGSFFSVVQVVAQVHDRIESPVYKRAALQVLLGLNHELNHEDALNPYVMKKFNRIKNSYSNDRETQQKIDDKLETFFINDEL